MGETVWSTAFFRALRPKSRLTVSEWADKYRHVAPGTSPEPGRGAPVEYLTCVNRWMLLAMLILKR
ncbi:Phage terminase large subunit [Salmonella enterica subsp. enterica]|nr:Phage terminase large subunit [Salmonella enterica subsp. enterica]